MKKKAILVILDGWGHGAKDSSNAIYLSNTPFIDGLYRDYPNTELKTFGDNVGLPDGQMGNSEVGHLNIGAGRIVHQDFARINNEVAGNTIDHNEELLKAYDYAKQNNKTVHFLGLVSDGGIHSHQNHVTKLCQIAHDKGLNDLFIHAFTDGRDTDPKGGLKYVEELQNSVKNTNAKIASVIGRYYAMDRDKRWERIKLAYDLMVNGIGEKATHVIEAIKKSYNNEVTDEFIKPIVHVNELGEPIATIKEGDVVICFNFRTDRCRQITEVLTQQNMGELGMKTLPLYYVTMTNYDRSFKNVKVLYEKDNLVMTLGEVIAKAGKKQIRIAETEKYPHVTFFFSGGREEPFEGESRIMVNSPKVATYDLQPEMNAHEVTDKILVEINKQSADFICLNYANPDMVGHTGDQKAVIKAVETIDVCTKQIVEAGIKNAYSFVIIADHGNAEKNFNEDGSPNTAHTTSMVPCFVISENVNEIHPGNLADVAPTILALMDITQPKEITGNSLIVKK
jgi:2,3-bisphosphoglycerate-independent phosphoglycerate mutase